MNFVEELLRASAPLPDRREIWEWAGGSKPDGSDAAVDFGNLYAHKGPYRVENTPWTREILRAFRDPRCREITAPMPPQESGKTLAAQVCIAERIVRKPACMQWNNVTNVKAKAFAETKWRQTVKSCAAVSARFSDDRHDTKKSLIIFRDSTYLMIQGAEVDANRQGDSAEVQVNDECQLWEEPWLEEMHTRTLSYRHTAKKLNLGLGGTTGTAWHTRWIESSQGEWSHRCPECRRLFQYRFNMRSRTGSNIHFDPTRIKVQTDGTIDFTDFHPTVYVTCPHEHCSHRLDYDEHLLARLNRNGEYVHANPAAQPTHIGVHANSFAIGAEPWGKIVEPWIRATIGRSVFATSLLKKFIQARLAEFWEERPIIVKKDAKIGDYTRAEARVVGFWKDEWIRVMAIDNQLGAQGDIPHRWFLAVAFSQRGEMRVIDCGRLNEWEDVRKKQLELGIPDWTPARPGPWVVCDRRHKPVEVDEICARYRWFGMLGTDSEEFLHPAGSPWEGQKVIFSDVRQIELGFGKTPEAANALVAEGRSVACYYLYAKQKIEDILATIRAGKAEPLEWPRDIEEFCPEYSTHMNSHHQVTESTKNGDRLVWRGIGHTPDHLLDCATEVVVMGLMAGVFKR